MITKLQKDEAMFNWYLNQARIEEAIQLIEGNAHLHHLWRQVALAFSEIEDVNNSIKYFRIAYESGDNKSLPWLVEILRNFAPSDSSLPMLDQKFNQLLDAKDFDVRFSYGNILLTQENFPEVLKIWDGLFGTRNHLIDLNVIDAFQKNIEEPIVHKMLGIKEGSSREKIYAHVEMMLLQYIPVDSRALFALLIHYSLFEDLIGNQEIVQEAFISRALELANNGDIDWIIQGYSMTKDFEDPRFEEFNRLVEANDLNYLLPQISDENYMGTQQTSTKNANYGNVSLDSGRIDQIFDEAIEAQKSNDTKREIQLWLEGSKLGSANCFFNYGIALGNSMGIACNMFGCSGAEGSIWGDLIKNIQQNGNRDFDKEIHKLELFLNSNLLKTSREARGITSAKAPLVPTVNSEITDKLIDGLEEIHVQYLKQSQNCFLIPYIDGDISFTLGLEVVNDGTQEFIMVNAPILYGNNLLSIHEQNLIKMLVRNSALIFPLSGFSFDVFGSLPDDKSPNFFINKMECSEFPIIYGNRIEELSIHCVPAKEQTHQYSIGIAIPSDLQSDHFLTALQQSLNIVTIVAANIQELKIESKELFENNFEHKTFNSQDIEVDLIDEDAQLAIQIPAKLFTHALTFAQRNGDVKPLIELARNGDWWALRMAWTIEDAHERFVHEIGELILGLSKNYSHDLGLSFILNDIGTILREQKRIEESNQYFLASAELGCTHALSSYTWQCLLKGEYEKGVELFNRVYYKVMTCRSYDKDFYETGNFRSNNALNRWALGADPEELRETWLDEYLQGDHAESKFYPILIDYEAGRTKEALAALADLPAAMRAELFETFTESKDNALWFGEISRKSLQLLEKLN